MLPIKQPPRGVPRKRCSENMRQIYRRTPVPKYDFNQAAKQLYLNHTLAWVFSRKFAAYFQNTFSTSKEPLGGCLRLLDTIFFMMTISSCLHYDYVDFFVLDDNT